LKKKLKKLSISLLAVKYFVYLLVTYPLRAPLVRPSTILFFTKNAKTNNGKTIIVAAAVSLYVFA